MFDTQTQTDLNFFLDSRSSATSILKHSSFSMNTDSSDTETQTDRISTAKNLPALESKFSQTVPKHRQWILASKLWGAYSSPAMKLRQQWRTLLWLIWPGTRWNLNSALLKPRRVQNYTQSPTSESGVHMGVDSQILDLKPSSHLAQHRIWI